MQYISGLFVAVLFCLIHCQVMCLIGYLALLHWILILCTYLSKDCVLSCFHCQYQSSDWLLRLPPQWPILCWFGC